MSDRPKYYHVPADEYHLDYPSGTGNNKNRDRRFYAGAARVADFKRLLFFIYPDEERFGDEVI